MRSRQLSLDTDKHAGGRSEVMGVFGKGSAWRARSGLKRNLGSGVEEILRTYMRTYVGGVKARHIRVCTVEIYEYRRGSIELLHPCSTYLRGYCRVDMRHYTDFMTKPADRRAAA